MKNIEDVLFVVQARLGSQRVPQKMIRPFASTTLCDIILQKVLDSDIPKDNFIFSVYEPELVNIGNKYGVNIFHRSKQSAQSEGEVLTEIYEWHILPYKYVVLISGCNPLLKVETINAFIKQYLQMELPGLFGVFPKRTYYWNEHGICITDFGDSPIMNTKIVKPVYEAGHCLYASSMFGLAHGEWLGNFAKDSPALFLMDELETFDIDHEWQFKVAEVLWRQGL
jgi:CMP-N-acetylneuraminic acid synthetase